MNSNQTRWGSFFSFITIAFCIFSLSAINHCITSFDPKPYIPENPSGKRESIIMEINGEMKKINPTPPIK